MKKIKSELKNLLYIVDTNTRELEVAKKVENLEGVCRDASCAMALRKSEAK